MKARVVNGWLMVGPYTGHDTEVVRINVAGDGYDKSIPAFLDRHEGERVAKIRPPVGPGRTVTVSLVTKHAITEIGRLVL